MSSVHYYRQKFKIFISIFFVSINGVLPAPFGYTTALYQLEMPRQSTEQQPAISLEYFHFQIFMITYIMNSVIVIGW